MDVVLWVVLIVVVIGAVWWFRGRRSGESNSAGRGEFDHEAPTMTQGLTDAVPQPPLVMNSAPESGLHRPPAEPDPTDAPAPTDSRAPLAAPAAETPPPADGPEPPARRTED
ncbi:hypothetical protein [Arthrobacter sp. AET 35A]|uniref:hypothetical protein n=1 Tax=Arthrobacter sp. AET 35A TaxID=2292643 RepID=UPI001784FFBA|nr:hypothetical protein [Arthrobacter sp. AET 35A]MBE0011525.1 hypothetical protein [Arthrobacter sp. AET 35A]